MPGRTSLTRMCREESKRLGPVVGAVVGEEREAARAGWAVKKKPLKATGVNSRRGIRRVMSPFTHARRSATRAHRRKPARRDMVMVARAVARRQSFWKLTCNFADANLHQTRRALPFVLGRQMIRTRRARIRVPRRAISLVE